jgi:transposase InsO family protein
VERDRRILEEWRKHPGLGPSQVKNQLRRKGLKTSTNTVRRVMEEAGYQPPKVKRERVPDDRYEAVRPNQLWHLDFFHRFVHKQEVFILLLVDDYSRFLVGHAVWEVERAEAVLRAFESAVARHGRPEMVMSDGGSAFYSWKGIGRFTAFLEELGCDQFIATRPQTNGKNEVLNANVQKELFSTEIFLDLGQLQRRLDAWVAFYNFRRTHHALGGILVPADRYFGRAEEVLAHIEAGRSPEGVGDPIPAFERMLDLFKVTSQKGEVSVNLMGRQIWPPTK